MKINYIILMGLTFFFSCNKLVEIDPPVNTIPSQQAFSTDADANASIGGIYSKLFRKQDAYAFGNGWITFFMGLSADELQPVTFDPLVLEVYRNSIRPQNANTSNAWNQGYESIYQANAAIEEMKKSTGMTEEAKRSFTAEARFLRALVYYYLVEIYGGVPLVLHTDWRNNITVPRESVEKINLFLVNELIEACNGLDSTYSRSYDLRVRATRYAGYTLLAKIYLTMGNYQEAEKYSNLVIENSTLYKLEDSPTSVFSVSSREAILQWHNSSSIYPFNVLQEAMVLLPMNEFNPPGITLSKSFMRIWDTADARWRSWIFKSEIAGDTFYSPYKYRTKPNELVANAPVTEYYTVFRLAELFLTRAEARAHLNNIDGAVADVNKIRGRSGLVDFSFSTPRALLEEVITQRQKELFCEWGDRWFTIKRVGIVDSVMSNESSSKNRIWIPAKKLWPIGLSELSRNPACVQNPGYN